MKILLLTQPSDVHAIRVSEHLALLDAEVDYFEFRHFLRQSQLRLKYGTHATDLSLRTDDGRFIEFGNYQSIWYRRPGLLQTETFPVQWVKNIVEQEASHTLWGMLNGLPCLWVNHPARDQQCLHKLLQLRLAAEVGLQIPETLVTNDPEEAREFYFACDGEVIYKMISEFSNHRVPAYQTPGGIPTLPVRNVDLQYFGQVALGPHLFQKRIVKTFDVRTTVVGHKIFSIRIDSQEGTGKLDWRQDYSVPMTEYDLPGDLPDKCLKLMRRFGLNYGAIDFCVTPEGEHYFLEINCAGQYMWIEQRTGLPISQELASILAWTSEPLVDTRKPFDYGSGNAMDSACSNPFDAIFGHI